jgi:hypothetical protein
MTITQIHTDEALAAATQSYSLSDVQAQVKLIETQRADYEQLRQQIAASEGKLQEMVIGLILPQGRERAEIFNLYWGMEGYVKVPSLRTLAERSLGTRDHKQWQAIIAGKTTVRCGCCRTEYEVHVSSRNDMNQTHACPSCLEQQKAERESWFTKLDADAQRRQELIAKMRTMPYVEYLKTDWWKRVRTDALKRAKYRCQLCGARDVRLEVHHNNYSRRGCEENADVIVLCGDCHEKHHDKGGEK